MRRAFEGVGGMDRLKILCFAGTYGLALAAELARVVVRNPLRWHLTVGLTFLGWCVQTAYLANLAMDSPTGLPVNSAFESAITLSWVVALIGRNGIEQLLVVVNDENDARIPADARLCLRMLEAQLRS